MHKIELTERIESFWDWFSENIGAVMGAIAFDNHPKLDEVVQNMDQHILGMGTVKWELGNPKDGQFTFTLSPNNKKELLEITRQIIAFAPQIEGWTFFYASPATGIYQVSVYDHEMDVQEIDASQWEVVLLNEPDGRSELIVNAGNIMNLDEDTQMIAVDLILTAVIGEETKINHLSGLQITDNFEDFDSENALPIQQLLFQLEG